MSDVIEIHWSSASVEEARKVAHLLAEEGHIACANIIPNVESIFFWEEKVHVQAEVKVIFKTLARKFEVIKEIILKNAKYELPEILQIPVTDGNSAYLEWIHECCT